MTAVQDLRTGDRIRVQFSDGRVIQDRFVFVSDDELVCRFATFAISEIDCVGRPAPKHLGEGIVLGALIVGLVLKALSAPWGPLAG